jgi:hypothetical protein
VRASWGGKFSFCVDRDVRATQRFRKAASRMELVGEVMAERARIRYAPPVPGDVRSIWADLERAARERGDKLRVALEEGLDAQDRRPWRRAPA